MTLRLTTCCAGALLLHGALLAFGSMAPPSRPLFAARIDETEIDLLAPVVPASEPAAAPAPAGNELAPRPAPDLRPRVAAHAAQRRSNENRIAPETAEAEPSLSEGPAAVADEPTPSKRLSLADLGVGVAQHMNGVASVQGALDAPARRSPDVGGLRQAQMARDTELGLGPGGAVASAVRTPARELAPLGSAATFSVDLAADGSVVAVSLDGVSSDHTAWNALLRVLRERLASLSVKVGRPTRVTLLVTNGSTLRAGNGSGSVFDFDLSNIGSPTIQSLHVRVVGQTPL